MDTKVVQLEMKASERNTSIFFLSCLLEQVPCVPSCVQKLCERYQSLLSTSESVSGYFITLVSKLKYSSNLAGRENLKSGGIEARWRKSLERCSLHKHIELK
jgi:hypothetical protein